MLYPFSTTSPPCHVTVDVSPPPERLEVDQTTGHQLVRGRGGGIVVMYKSHWAGLLSLLRNTKSIYSTTGPIPLLLVRDPFAAPADQPLIPP